MIKNYFENLDYLGNLNLIRTDFEFEHVNIVFLCKDNKDNFYLCICTEIRGSQEWIISDIDINVYEDMTNSRIDVKTAFDSSNEYYKIQYLGNNKYNVKKVNYADLAEENIPDEGIYLKE